MTNATLHLHTRHQVGEVDLRVFGGFLEHMGRAVYQGVFDPTSAHADEHGCRRDVLDALDRLGFRVMRYPGGNFVSNYHWTDGVGPVDKRPTVRELAWGSIEPNTFGTDEFLALAARMNWIPMFAVNLGTGSPEEAADWVEYCNASAGTRFADLRAANGHPEPWAVPLWCLGNEMDGPWQVERVPVGDYGVKASQAAHMMKLVDPSIETVVSGSSTAESPTWMSWDREALETVGGLGQYLSTHRYVGNPDGDTRRYLTTGALIDRQIDEMDAVCRYTAGLRRGRRPYIAFDEWNVWYRTQTREEMIRGLPFPGHLIEEVFDHQDALIVAQFLNSFIRRADVVKVANLAQIVNVIAPLLTRGDDLLFQTIFHSLAMYRDRQAGRSLRVAYDGAMVDGPFGTNIPGVDASVILGEDVAHIFAVNRLVDQPVDLGVVLADRAVADVASAELLHHDDPEASNTWDDPSAVTAVETDRVRVVGGTARIELPPLGFVACTLGLN